MAIRSFFGNCVPEPPRPVWLPERHPDQPGPASPAMPPDFQADPATARVRGRRSQRVTSAITHRRYALFARHHREFEGRDFRPSPQVRGMEFHRFPAGHLAFFGPARNPCAGSKTINQSRNLRGESAYLRVGICVMMTVVGHQLRRRSRREFADEEGVSPALATSPAGRRGLLVSRRVPGLRADPVSAGRAPLPAQTLCRCRCG